MDDAEEQSMELEAIKSIYGEDAIIKASSQAYSLELSVELDERRVHISAIAAPAPSAAAVAPSSSYDICQPIDVADAPFAADCGSIVRDPLSLVSERIYGAPSTAPLPPMRTASGRRLAAEVSSLPPITLAVTHPADYPSTSPPRFTISCLWLTRRQLSMCAKQLDELWETECVGSICVFRWAEWIRHELIEALGLLEDDGQLALNLAQSDDDVDLDPRAIAESVNPEADFTELVRYDAETKEQRWRESVVSCPICLEEHIGASCIRGMGGACDHVACSNCLTAMAEAAVGDGGDVDDLKCPVVGCRAPVPASLLRQLVSPEVYTRWEQRKKSKLLAQLPGLVYCPRCDPSSADFKRKKGTEFKSTLCKFFAEGKCKKGSDCKYAHGVEQLLLPAQAVPCLPVDEGDDLCICPKCDYSFCAACLEGHHPGRNCISDDAREEYLRRKQEQLEAGGLQSEARAQFAAARAKLEELKSLTAIKETTRKCPGCQEGIERTAGCNHMHCTICGTHFCWQCGEKIDDANPYDHFRSDKCRIFPDNVDGADNEYLRLNAAARREDRLARQLLQREVFQAGVALIGQDFGAIKRCPFCAQRNVKGEDGSNHHTCWNCRGVFCFLCAADLRRGVRGHFTRAHPQHGREP